MLVTSILYNSMDMDRADIVLLEHLAVTDIAIALIQVVKYAVTLNAVTYAVILYIICSHIHYTQGLFIQSPKYLLIYTILPVSAYLTTPPPVSAYAGHTVRRRSLGAGRGPVFDYWGDYISCSPS